MNVERFEISREKAPHSLERPQGNGAKKPASKGSWVSIGLGLGAVAALVVLRGRSRGKRARAAARGYDMFLNKVDNCEKVVLKAA
jgi:hypothetical protein